MKRAIVVLLLLAGVVLAAGPLWLGFAVERAYHDFVAAASEAARGRYEIEGRIERGWLRSRATTTLTLPSETGGEAFVAPLEHELVHGPIPVGELLHRRSPLHLVFAVVDTRYDADPETLPRIRAALGERPLLRLRAWLGLDRSLRLLLLSPAFGLEDGSLRSEGLRAEAVRDGRRGSLEGSLRAGPFELRGAQTALRLAATIARLQVAPADAPTEAGALPRMRVVGQAAIGALTAGGETSRLQIADSRMSLDGEVVGAEWLAGQGRLVLGDLELSQLGPPRTVRLALRGLRLEESTERDAETGLSRLAGELVFDELELRGRRYGPGRAQLAVRNVDSRAWQRLQLALAELEDRGIDESEQDRARATLVMERMPELLGSSPEIALETVELTADAGSLEASARLGVDASEPTLLSNPMLLLALLQGEARLSIAQRLAHELLDAYLADGVREEAGPVGEEQIMEMAAFVRAAMLGRLIEEGKLLTDGVRYRVEAHLREGLPIVNGQPVDPDFLSGLVPGF